MFREMRRKKQALTQEECFRILDSCTAGVLALHGDDGYPYAVPLSYVRVKEKIYFHSALSGHKIDAVRRDPKASFCVISQDTVVPEKFTTFFSSVIAFGRVRILEEESEKRHALEALALRYSPLESRQSLEQEIRRNWNRVLLLEMTVDHLSGKQAIELAGK